MILPLLSYLLDILKENMIQDPSVSVRLALRPRINSLVRKRKTRKISTNNPRMTGMAARFCHLGQNPLICSEPTEF